MYQNKSDENTEFEENLQALPVCTLVKGADLSQPPTTGEEYLLRVRLEASQLPDVCVAKIDVPPKMSQNVYVVRDLSKICF